VAVYNDSFMNNVTSPLDLFTRVSSTMFDSTGNYEFLLGNMILFSFMLIFLAFGNKFSWSEVMIVDGFLSMIVAILLYGSGLLQAYIITIPFSIFAIGLVFYMSSN